MNPTASRAAALAILLVFSFVATAHGPPGPIQQDSCAQKLGEHYVHFNAYQPDGDATGHYCDIVPLAGHTIIVLDLVDRSLRKQGVALKIMRKMDITESEQVVSLSRRAYDTGVVETSIETMPSGEYLIEVSAGSGVKPVRFNLSVGTLASGAGSLSAWITYIIIAGLFLFLGRRFLRHRGA